MRKFRKWVTENKTLYLVLSCTCMMLFLVFLLVTEASTWMVAMTIIYLFYMTILYPNYCRIMQINEAIQVLNNQCDPYPLLEVTEQFLQKKHSELEKQIYEMNYCVALRDIGEYEKVYRILSELNIDKCGGMTLVNKIVYYNNRADICTVMDKYEEADIWHKKMMQLYDGMRDGKTKQNLARMIRLAEAAELFRTGSYAETVKILRREEANCVRQDVSNCMLCGRAYLKLGETERAKEQLQVVVDKGNRVYEVIEAKELLGGIR